MSRCYIPSPLRRIRGDRQVLKNNAAPHRRVVLVLLASMLGVNAASAAVVVDPDPIPEDAKIDIVGGTSGGSLLWLDFDNERAFELSGPGYRKGFGSLAFYDNACAASQDVIAAETDKGRLLLIAQEQYTQGEGEGLDLCDTINCPQRPAGLSTSADGLLASTDLHTKAVWIFEPAGCGDPGALLRSIDGGVLQVVDGKSTTDIGDTEFVQANGPGLAEGDLLVLARTKHQGWTIARIRAADIALLRAGEVSSLPAAEALLPPGFFGHDLPTGMAFVPGPGPDGQSSVLLVTVKEGRVLQLSFGPGGDGPNSVAYAELDFPAGTDLQRARGVRTGKQDGSIFAVIADERSEEGTDRFLRIDLEQGDSGFFAVPGFQSIPTSSGAPQGIAILSDEEEEQLCVDLNPGELPTTGCILANSVQVHLSMGYDGTLPPGARVSANLAFIPDPRPAGSELPLVLGVDEGFLAGDGEYSVPASCRGFPVDPEDERFGGVPQLVLLDMGLNFDITPGNFIQVRELAIRSLGLDENLDENKCDQTGARIYYHPQDDSGGTLFDTTFSCQNPSRSIVENFSPVVFCVDPLYLERKFPPAREKRNEAVHKTLQVNREIKDRIETIKQVISELPNSPEFVALSAALEKRLNTANTNASGAQPKYLSALSNVDDAALAVFSAKRDLDLFNPQGQPGVDRLTYGRLLSRLLALSFYISETGALEEYRPPAPFCEPIYDIDGDGFADFPELPDVFCAAPESPRHFPPGHRPEG